MLHCWDKEVGKGGGRRRRALNEVIYFSLAPFSTITTRKKTVTLMHNGLFKGNSYSISFFRAGTDSEFIKHMHSSEIEYAESIILRPYVSTLQQVCMCATR